MIHSSVTPEVKSNTSAASYKSISTNNNNNNNESTVTKPNELELGNIYAKPTSSWDNNIKNNTTTS